MSKNRKETDPSDISQVAVELKPILGIRPGIYITILCGIALFLVLFFLTVYPGLRNRGIYFDFASSPGNATIAVDGKYAGTTPCRVLLSSGTRSIIVTKPYYSPISMEKSVGGRIVGTLFFPHTEDQAFDLVPSDIHGMLEWLLSDLQKNPEIPTPFTEAAAAAIQAGKAGISPETSLELSAFADDLMYFITNEAQLSNWLSSAYSLATEQGLLTGNGLVGFVQNLINVKEKYENSPFWLLLSLSRDNLKRVASSEWIVATLQKYRDRIARYYEMSGTLGLGSRQPGGSVVVRGVGFMQIPAGTLVMGRDDDIEAIGSSIDATLPHPVDVGAFHLSTTEITCGQFEAFLKENPRWQPDNTDALVQEGLVTEDYLAGWTREGPPPGSADIPVTSVSYDAAAAYCEWLTAKSPGLQARLPTEAEWEWAARGGLRGMPYPLGERPGASVFYVKDAAGPKRAGTSEPNGYGLRDMMGNVWEWCGDSFTPRSYTLTSLDPAQNARLASSLPECGDKVVRGGAWNTQRELAKVYTRASQPSDWCTPYLGFRVALVRT